MAVASKFLSTADGGAHWTVRNLPTSLANPGSLSCPNATACVLAAVGELGGTTNGGSSWKATADPAGASDLTKVSCGSSTTCLAVGSTPKDAYSASTKNDGTSWAALPEINPTGYGFRVGGLKCVSATACVVGGEVSFFGAQDPGTTGDAVTTSDGGQSWSLSTVPGVLYGVGPGMLDGVSCFGASECVAVGLAAGGSAPAVAVSSTDGGVTWSAGNLPTAGVNDLSAVSCRSGGPCEAAGDGALGPVMLRAGSATAAFSAQGAPVFAQTMSATACPTASHCVAVGSANAAIGFFGVAGALVSNNGGTLWTQASLPAQADGLSSVSCASASDCVAVGTTDEMADDENDPVQQQAPAAVYSSDGGLVWREATLPSGLSTLYDVSCPATAATPTCFAVGFSGDGINTPVTPTVITSTDGGAGWQAVTVPSDGTEDFTGISCSSAKACVAVGGGAIIATTNGSTWTTQTVPSGAVAPYAVGCPTATACVAVGSDRNGAEPHEAIYTANGGKTWLTGTTPNSTDALDGVNCSTASDCLAAGSALLRTTNGGKTWSAVSVPAAASPSTAGPGCVPAGTLCLLAGAAQTNIGRIPAAILRSTNSGTSWSAQILALGPDSPDTTAAVLCPQAATCIAAGASTTINTAGGVSVLPTVYASGDAGGLWSTTLLSDDLIGDLSSAACAPNSLICVTTDRSSLWRTTNGGRSWSTGTLPTGTILDSLVCPAATACVAVGEIQTGTYPSLTITAEAFTSANGGSSWTPTPLPGSLVLNSLGCTSATQCVALGSDSSLLWDGPVAATSANGGKAWVETSLPPSATVAFAAPFSCLAGGGCLAVASDSTTSAPEVVDTTDGGASWAVDPAPSSVTSIAGVACSSASACVAAANGASPGGIVLQGKPAPRRRPRSGRHIGGCRPSVPAGGRLRPPGTDARWPRCRARGGATLSRPASRPLWAAARGSLSILDT